MVYMQVRMKSLTGSPAGWLLALGEAGCSASYTNEPFGRTYWLVKKDGEAIGVTQAKNIGFASVIDNPTKKQIEIAEALVSVGVASAAVLEDTKKGAVKQ